MDNSAKILEVLVKISDSLDEIKNRMSGKETSKVVSAPKVEEPKEKIDKGRIVFFLSCQRSHLHTIQRISLGMINSSRSLLFLPLKQATNWEISLFL